MNKYTVWVGGTEVNDHYLTKKQAYNLADYYQSYGYDDIIIEKYDNRNSSTFHIKKGVTNDKI